MKRILNAGCWKSEYGTDFVDLYPQRDDVKRCDLDRDRLPYSEDTFDEVYCHGVIDHLCNPANFVTEAYRVLKPKGTLIVYTANAGLYGWWSNAYYGGYERDSGNWHRGNQDRPFGLHTVHTLRNLIGVAPFVLKHVGYAPSGEKEGHIAKSARIAAGRHITNTLGKLNRRWMPLIRLEAAKANNRGRYHGKTA